MNFKFPGNWAKSDKWRQNLFVSLFCFIFYFLTFSIDTFRKVKCIIRFDSNLQIRDFSRFQIWSLISDNNFEFELNFCVIIRELTIDNKGSNVTGLFWMKKVVRVLKLHKMRQARRRKMKNRQLRIFIYWEGVIWIAQYSYFLLL